MDGRLFRVATIGRGDLRFLWFNTSCPGAFRVSRNFSGPVPLTDMLNMKPTHLFLIVSAILPATAPGQSTEQAASDVAASEGAATPRPAPRFVDRVFEFDQDGNGLLSMDELPEPLAQRLRRADRNDDKKISRDELLAHLKAHLPPADRAASGRSAGRPEPGPGADGSGPDGNRPTQSSWPGRGRTPPFLLLKALDANSDGQLTAEEINNATAALKTLDRNGDGMISPAELRPADGRPEDRRAAAKPGERPSQPASAAAGRSADPSQNTGRMAGYLLGRFDANGDDRLSTDELPEVLRERFASMDANSDGFIDRAEITARERQLARQRQSMTPERRRGNGPPGPGAFEQFAPGGDQPRRPALPPGDQ